MDDINDEDGGTEWGCPSDEKVVPIKGEEPAFDPENVRVFIGGVELNGSSWGCISKTNEDGTVELRGFDSTDCMDNGFRSTDDMPESNDNICRAPLRLVTEGE